MTLLVVSPDYASHLLPLASLATAWRDRGQRVVVATGEATAGIVAGFGYERVDLRLGRGSNPGVIRAEQQPRGEDEALRGFFDATRQGSVETLAFQARARSTDLMWEPVPTARAVLDVVDAVRPEHVLVDHLAFTARLALSAAGVRHADVVLGHPTALPVGEEVYGLPPAWPGTFRPEGPRLAELRRLCEDVRDAFTDQWNAALTELDPGATASPDAFAEHGDLLLLNHPAELADPARTALLPPHAFLGSAVRDEPADPEVETWLAAGDAPVVYVSLGSFLSVRADVLARVAAALRELPVRVALATGSAPVAELGAMPGSWLVREYLPQVRLLRSAAAAVTHGGNNSVTEAMTFGVPLVVLPFSTDQFAAAASVEAAGVGVALPPNTASVAELREAVRAVDGSPRDRSHAVAAALQADPGPARARRAVLAGARC
ncbi:MAG: nucleotide disphospho-sugar-binding domain-containing protein [Kineosporiaceae bacterium]